MAALLRLGEVEPRRRTDATEPYPIHSLEVGSGPPLLLIHGASGGAANWYRLLGPLSSDHWVHAPDLPGFGLSPALTPRPGLGEQTADVLLAWAHRTLHEPFDVVGTSFGGLVALRMAQRAPGSVRRLVLIDSVGLGRMLPAVVRASTLPVIRNVLRRPTRSGTAWLLRRLMVADPRRLAPDEREALIDYLWVSARAGAAMLAEAMVRFAGLGGQYEVLSDGELGAIDHPTLVLWGERDRFLPLSHGERAARHIPRASLDVIPNVGHSPNWEAPRDVGARLRRFLRTT